MRYGAIRPTPYDPAAAPSLGGITAASGTADAASDTDCAYSTCITGWSYFDGLNTVETTICNYQSAPNDFVLPVKDDESNKVFDSYTTPYIDPGHCLPQNRVTYRPYATGPVQFFARSGSRWSYGTDPVQAG
ncbi:hypothetical protein [Streptomyces sp. NPDC021356]|uniref:hypothetical protein n=1 Tax=Streptomyces sp. NPDC021356 TaxID=3154900 RepID=UPI0033F5E34C